MPGFGAVIARVAGNLRSMHRTTNSHRIQPMTKQVLHPLLAKFLVALASTVGLASSAAAHDFWIAPERYEVDSGTPLVLRLSMGHPDDVLAWPVSFERVVYLRAIGPQGVVDLQSSLATASSDGVLRLPTLPDGHYVITIASTQAFSELPADAFAGYLDEEGLDAVEADRTAKGQQNRPGRELYSRRGKTLVTVGAPRGMSDVVGAPLGQTLEIVPITGIGYDGGANQLSASIRYRGVPMDGVQVKLVRLGGQPTQEERGLVDKRRSERGGVVRFERPPPGTYMMQAIWSSPSASRNAEYATVFSSFSFQID